MTREFDYKGLDFCSEAIDFEFIEKVLQDEFESKGYLTGEEAYNFIKETLGIETQSTFEA